MKPLEMRCEFIGCGLSVGADYKRLPNEQFGGWEDEPIFLCPVHSEGHEPIAEDDSCGE